MKTQVLTKPKSSNETKKTIPFSIKELPLEQDLVTMQAKIYYGS